MPVRVPQVIVPIALILGAMCALCAQSPPERDPFGELARAWSATLDYTLDIDAHERDGERTQDRTMHFWYLRPDHAKLQLTSGPFRGVVVTWSGGATMSAHHSGLFAIFRKNLSLDDPHASSLRGNSITTPILGPAIACLSTHRAAMIEREGPQIRGEATDEIDVRVAGGFHCPDDPPRDKGVTRDLLFVSRVSHLPLRRVRYVGDEEVERWELSNVRINTGLTPNDFR